ncbi:MAG: Gfo/Idh/MocA family oxidoreductase [Chloroflexi bacterium]|nr:Gfo/Idh/MocA family oxidoreductase [Chloroflexota bacterium]
MTSQKPMKIGIIGLGFDATEFIPSLERCPDVEIYAGADLRPQALTEFEKRYGGKTYKTAEELCADPDVEAVWIATPNHLHAQNAIVAANAGKHICLRKPMGVTMQECEDVMEAVDRNGVKLLSGGQTMGSSPLTIEMRRVITSGEIGPLRAMSVTAYTGWMLRPRMPQEVSDADGGGVVWRQAPHQLETTRYLGGGLVRSVRAYAGHWRPERPNGTGYYSAFMEFEDGTPTTLVYNSYGYFDSMDLTNWLTDKGHEGRAKFRAELLAGAVDEETRKEATRFGGSAEGSVVGGADGRPWAPGNLGVLIATCESGDLRMSAQGIYIYDDSGMREVAVHQPGGQGMTLESEIMELINAIRHDTPMLHDGRWGWATAELQWAILESGKQHKEIMLTHQVAVPEGY